MSWAQYGFLVAGMAIGIFMLGWLSCYLQYRKQVGLWTEISDSQVALNASFETAHDRLFETVIREKTVPPELEQELVSHEKPEVTEKWTPIPRNVDTFVISPRSSRIHRRNCGVAKGHTDEWAQLGPMTDKEMLEFALTREFEVCARCILNDESLTEVIKSLEPGELAKVMEEQTT